MGVINKPLRCIYPYSNPPNLKEVQPQSQIDQFTSLPFGLNIATDNQPGKVRTQTHSIFFSFMGYEYHLDSTLVKKQQIDAQTLGFEPKDKAQTCFDCNMFDVANWVAYLNREDGSKGLPSHETLSVAGHPPSLVKDHFSSPRMVAKCCQRTEGLRHLSQRPQYSNLY